MRIHRNIKYKPKPISRFLLLMMLSIMVARTIQAQDIHFSQYYTTSLFINPANTGIYNGNIRFANNYRNQWSKLGTPINTYFSAFDTKLKLFKQNIGIGGLIIHDQSSVYGLTTDEFKISVSYSRFINNQQFTIGFQPGFSFKKYDEDGLTFGSQFNDINNIFDSDLSSMEYGLTGNTGYFDMNVGIGWRTFIHNIMPSAGFSVSHVLKPRVTFTNTSVNTCLERKYMFNGQVIIPVKQNYDLIPGFLYSAVSGANELLIGATGGYRPDDILIPVKKLYITAMLRSNLFSNVDAVILGVGARFPTFDLGFSYDFNISTLHHVSNYNGAFEISIVFTGSAKNTISTAPCMIY